MSIIGISLIDPVFAQEVIQVNSTTPCFLNYTAGVDMWQNCGFGADFLEASIAPWEWITGGHFTLILVSIFVMFTYIKYHKAIYPVMIGVMFLPLSYFVFPDSFLIWSLTMTGLVLSILIWYVYIKQPKEY